MKLGKNLCENHFQAYFDSAFLVTQDLLKIR